MDRIVKSNDGLLLSKTSSKTIIQDVWAGDNRLAYFLRQTKGEINPKQHLKTNTRPKQPSLLASILLTTGVVGPPSMTTSTSRWSGSQQLRLWKSTRTVTKSRWWNKEDVSDSAVVAGCACSGLDRLSRLVENTGPSSKKGR